MSDTRDILRSTVKDFEPAADAFERVLVRRDRKRRNARVGAGVVGVAIFALAVLGLARLVASERTAGPPEPTTNGRWVVFSALHLDPDPDAPQVFRGQGLNLYVSDGDGTARLLVGTEGSTTTRHCPAFSSDGMLLAWGEKAEYAKAGGEIVISGFAPSGQLRGEEIRVQIPTSLSHSAPPCPMWSPAGQRLAVVAPRIGLLIVNADGSTRSIDLHASVALDDISRLEWSPDGLQIAVQSYSDSPWVIPVDGGAQVHLTEFDAVEQLGFIEWTDDGSLVVTGSHEPLGLDSGPFGLDPVPFVDVVNISTGAVFEVPLPKSWAISGGPFDIRSAGNGRFVVIRDWKRPDMLDLQGHVTTLSGLGFRPASFISLSPDGEQMLYVAIDPNSAAQALVAVPLDGGEPTRYSPWTPRGFGDNYSTFAMQPG
jgi:WD40 repeat protein